MVRRIAILCAGAMFVLLVVRADLAEARRNSCSSCNGQAAPAETDDAAVAKPSETAPTQVASRLRQRRDRNSEAQETPQPEAPVAKAPQAEEAPKTAEATASQEEARRGRLLSRRLGQRRTR